MRYKAILIVFTATLILLTACQPDSVPEYQIVIETIPAQLHDVINIMQIRNGVYVFDPEVYGTGKDTYFLISHGRKDNVMVDIDTMEYLERNELKIILKETTASMTRPYTVIKLFNYNGKLDISNLDGLWPSLDTEDLYYSSRGTLSRLKAKELNLTIGDATLLINIDEALQAELQQASKPIAVEGDEVVIEYVSLGAELWATNLRSIADSGTLSGEYVGQIDSHSIEIVANGTPRAFQLSLAAEFWLEQTPITSGDAIEFDYYTTTDGTGVITKFITE